MPAPVQAGRPPPPSPDRVRARSFRFWWISLPLICIVGGVVVVAGFLVSSGATFELFGNVSTEREVAIADQALLVTVWGAMSAACAAVALAGRRWLAVAAIVWTAALVATRPWWWPGPPTDDFVHVPIWWNDYARPILLVLAILSLAHGLILSWPGGRPARIISVVVAVSVSMLLGMSGVRLWEARQAELPQPTAHGMSTLRAVEADPVWGELPSTADSELRTAAGTAAPWREEWPSWVRWWAPVDEADAQIEADALFDEVIAAAEETGWSLIAARCDDDPNAWFTKEVGSSEQATMHTSVAWAAEGVSVNVRVEPPDPWLLDEPIELC